jgi:hypothetical protein
MGSEDMGIFCLRFGNESFWIAWLHLLNRLCRRILQGLGLLKCPTYGLLSALKCKYDALMDVGRPSKHHTNSTSDVYLSIIPALRRQHEFGPDQLLKPRSIFFGLRLSKAGSSWKYLQMSRIGATGEEKPTSTLRAACNG